MQVMLSPLAAAAAVVVGLCALASAQTVCDGDVSGCQALAVYVVSPSDTLFIIANRFNTNLTALQSLNSFGSLDEIQPGQLVRIPFNCDCPTFSHTFSYSTLQGDSESVIATIEYGNLTTAEAIDTANPDAGNIDPGTVLRIPINCSCGDPSVSKEYGLFGTYAAQANDTLSSLSRYFNISEELIQHYNPTVSFDPLQPFVSILFIPLNNSNGQYPPYVAASESPAGGGGGSSSSTGIIVGAGIGGGVFILVLGLGIWFLRTNYNRKAKEKDEGRGRSEEAFIPAATKFGNIEFLDKRTNKWGALPADHCINFSLDELAAATDNFSISKQIGQGGFATVFYGEWQGQKLAVKKMDMKATKEFSNELTILSSVHHANLVGLIGYCTEGYLFLVYEFVDNGTLAHHLRSGTEPMRWSTRVQIALDAARGIEYMHDHTRPTYIHRDLKPNNILIDSNFHAKVGDFGLTRLMDPNGDGWTKTFTPYGTYGYMAPE